MDMVESFKDSGCCSLPDLLYLLYDSLSTGHKFVPPPLNIRPGFQKREQEGWDLEDKEPLCRSVSLHYKNLHVLNTAFCLLLINY